MNAHDEREKHLRYKRKKQRYLTYIASITVEDAIAYLIQIHAFENYNILINTIKTTYSMHSISRRLAKDKKIQHHYTTFDDEERLLFDMLTMIRKDMKLAYLSFDLLILKYDYVYSFYSETICQYLAYSYIKELVNDLSIIKYYIGLPPFATLPDSIKRMMGQYVQIIRDFVSYNVTDWKILSEIKSLFPDKDFQISFDNRKDNYISFDIIQPYLQKLKGEHAIVYDMESDTAHISLLDDLYEEEYIIDSYDFDLNDAYVRFMSQYTTELIQPITKKSPMRKRVQRLGKQKEWDEYLRKYERLFLKSWAFENKLKDINTLRK